MSLLPGDHSTDQSPGAGSVANVSLVLVVTVASLVGFLERAKEPLETEGLSVLYLSPDVLGVGLTLAGCAALLWRRSFPGVVLGVTTFATVAGTIVGDPPAPLPYALVVASFTVGQRWSLARSTVVLVPVLLGLAVSAFARFGAQVDDEVLTEVLAVLAAWALGRQYQLDRLRAALLEQQARHLTQERTTVAALAAAHERATIARELHDVVAHDVSVIVARAGAARRREELDGGRAVEVFESIESIGRDALTDMRRMVGVLHPVGDDGVTAGWPRLDGLEDLVARVSGTGTDVRLTVTGDRRQLSPTVELNAYRIVQESLTNALKHAGGCPVTVRVCFGPERLHLLVRDFGGTSASGTSSSPVSPTAQGNGLRGMRQRVDLLGGTLHAGPAADGGFAVDCVLPVAAREVTRDGPGADR